MLKVLQFQPKEKQQEAQPRVNETLCVMLADMYQRASTGELRSLVMVGTTANRETLMAYATDINNPDILKLLGLMEACKLRMLDEGMDFGDGEE
jgi:hypothetical protein